MTDPVSMLARTPVLLVALDFDGTLSPLEDEPMEARMLAEARIDRRIVRHALWIARSKKF